MPLSDKSLFCQQIGKSYQKCFHCQDIYNSTDNLVNFAFDSIDEFMAQHGADAWLTNGKNGVISIE